MRERGRGVGETINGLRHAKATIKYSKEQRKLSERGNREMACEGEHTMVCLVFKFSKK